MKNDYYDIAYNNWRYLEIGLSYPMYNDLAVSAQQVAEKMLKSAVEHTCIDVESLLKSHNLRALYDKIHQAEPDFVLDRNALSTLKDYYFDAKYPGDNFVSVTREECQECLEIMYDVIEQVNQLRNRLGLYTEHIPRKMLLEPTEDEVLED